ncbi:MAG: DMT family transporter [Burkholderiaceae bacterium]
MALRSAAPRYATGVACCVAATVSFGLMFPVMQRALHRLDPFSFTSLRYLLAAVVMVIALALTEGPAALRVRGRPLLTAWLLGSAGFAGFGFLVFLGQKLAGEQGALNTSILAATQPLLGALIHSVMTRRMAPWTTWLCFLISFCGVALVISNGDLGNLLGAPGSLAPSAITIAGMLCWVIYSFGSARFPDWSPIRYTTITMALGLTSIVAINLVLFSSRLVAVPTAQAVVETIPELLYMSLGAGVLGVSLWNAGNRLLTPINAVLFLNVPTITAFAVSALTGVVPTPIQIVGVGLTCCALVLNNLFARRRAINP